MNQNQPDFDVVIIGGGPAGSAMGSYLAKEGVRCVILERQLFPRMCVGESLVPAANRTLQDIGFIEKMDELGFPRKHGAAWTSPERSPLQDQEWQGIQASSLATHHFKELVLPGVENDYTWHVDRARFDTELLQHAQSLGASVIQGIRVKHVEFPDSTDDPVRVQYDLGRRVAEITARMVVDASGRRTFLGSKKKFKVLDPDFDQYASFCWFEGFDRQALSEDPDLEGYVFIHFFPTTNTWMWQIPISDTVTSIGVVTQKEHFAKTQASRDEFFWKCLAARPPVHDAVKNARQMFPLRAEADYSYAMKQICGDRFVMVGDAARFVDPIFSSGVSIAFASVKLASQDILQALNAGDFSRSAFQEFETRMTWGIRHWYQFITLFYRLNVLFTYFVEDPQYRLDVQRLLMGDVYDEQEPAVLGKMRDLVQAVENDPNHVWHKDLSDLTAGRFAGVS